MIRMSEESDSDLEMGNSHGSGKKNGNDSDPDYKYVSIVDVNSPSPQYVSAPEYLSQSVEGDGNGEILKCSLVIGGHSVSRVSVNSDEYFDHVPFASTPRVSNGLTADNAKMHNGSSLMSNGSPSVRVVHESSESVSEEPYIPSSSVNANIGTWLLDEAFIDSNPHSHIIDTSHTSPHEAPNGSSSANDGEVEVHETSEEPQPVREKLKRQRSGSSDYWNHEDSEDHCIVDFLDKINDHAEARLAAKRQARAEAREIRMRELEKMQRESEDGDRVYDVYSSPGMTDAVNRCVRAGSVATPRSLISANNSYHSSRRSSEDSLEEVNNIRDVRHELKELEEKFRKAMIANAQLDNEKAAAAFQVDLLKDRYEELEEQNLQLLREHKETCRQLEQTRRHRSKLQEDLDVTRSQLSELAQLIEEKGLVVVEGDCSSSDEESEGTQPRDKKPPRKALVSAELAGVLEQGTGSLDVRLKKFVEERNELLDELRRVKLELEEERAHSRGRHPNGPSDDNEDIQREANKLLGDYKFKLQKAEQDVNTLQANMARLESQVVRYKSAAETSEKLEDELKSEKRKLQRELREAQARVEELETSHSHLQRRLDKLKNAKSALLKDL